MSYASVSELFQASAAALAPPADVRLSEWAEEHFRLSSESSAAAGRLELFAYQREPLDAMSPQSPYEQVVLCWASQMSKTSLTVALLAHVIAEQPGPALIVQPTLSMAEAFSKDRLAPMLRDLPVLRGKVRDAKSRDAGSTIYHRRFDGGSISIVGSNSPAGLASRAIRYLVLDEVDRFEASAGAEGRPSALAIARTRTFWNRKVVWTSTPTVKGASEIEAAFAASDQQYFLVPCPLCGHHQRLVWANVEWPEGAPGDAAYRCASCREMIPHHRKLAMLAGGRWRPENPSSAIAGFHLSELYSPWRSWGELAADWGAAQGDPERLRAFLNTSLAETWDDQAIAGVTEADLLARRENFGPSLPPRAAILTAGIDVQADRLEASVYAWGRGEEAWLMAHRVFAGDPSTPAPWEALDAFLLAPWQHPAAGPLPVHAACVDSGAFTQMVCNFCDQRRGRRVFAVKGAAGARPVWPRKQSKAPRGRVFLVGVDSCKATITARLKFAEGPGAIHFPAWCGLTFFEQLNSEFERTVYKRGRPERSWQRRKGRAAEALDCAVYAYAALYGLRDAGVYLDVEADRLDALAGAELPAAGYTVARSRFMGAR